MPRRPIAILGIALAVVVVLAGLLVQSRARVAMKRAARVPKELQDRELEDQRNAEMTKWLAELAGDVGLRPSDVESLQKMLFSEWVDVREAFRDAYSGPPDAGPRPSAFAKIVELRAATDANARAILDDEQYKAYLEKRRSDGLANPRLPPGVR